MDDEVEAPLDDLEAYADPEDDRLGDAGSSSGGGVIKTGTDSRTMGTGN